jgi:hypothetical protein
VVGRLDGPLDIRFPDLEIETEEFVEAMKRLTTATQTFTFQMNDLTASFMKLLTGGWVFWWGAGVKPMAPGMVIWDGRRRRKRRKRT